MTAQEFIAKAKERKATQSAAQSEFLKEFIAKVKARAEAVAKAQESTTDKE